MLTQRAPGVSQQGFATPIFSPDDHRGSPLHARVARLATAKYRGFWRRYRQHYLDRFRLRKLAYIATRRHFALRALNFATYLLERNRAVRVHYAPVVVCLDPSNHCNLRCPGCTTGLRDAERRPRGVTSLELMKTLIDRVHRRTLQLQLSHWGEPFLNSALYEACAYAVDKGLWTTLHSNLSLRIPGLAQRIVASRLCHLVVSCDGATQAAYQLYRVRGDVELVFRNIHAVREERERNGARWPWITAKFIVFDHNWHEMELFRERALAAGADDVLFIGGLTDGVYETRRVASEREFDLAALRYRARPLGTSCRELWESITFDVDGAVFPCCDAFRERDLFADAAAVNRSSIMELWNGERFRRMRSFFSERSPRAVDLPTPCDTCERTLRHRGASTS